MKELDDGVEQVGGGESSRERPQHAGPGLERTFAAGRDARSARLFVGSSKNRSSEPASLHRPNSLSSR